MVIFEGLYLGSFTILNVDVLPTFNVDPGREESSSGRKQKVLQQFLSSILAHVTPRKHLKFISNIRFCSVRYMLDIVAHRKRS